MEHRFDAVVVGGGFFGATIAVYLAKERGLGRIALVEREPVLLTHASYNNQARVHNGYHYPRSFTTAFRSRINFPRFLRDWEAAIRMDFVKLYAIARRNSKVTARQFERFCAQIGADVRRAEPALRALFEPRLIEDVFVVEECAFDSGVLARRAAEDLRACAVDIRLETVVGGISRGPADTLLVSTRCAAGRESAIACHHVFNCTYSGLNQFSGDFGGTRTELKHEITEMALVRPPPELRGLGITVMDGPFFSIMPFPPRSLHTLSHVRYTPHLHWPDRRGVDPYRKLLDYGCETHVDRMVRDAARYLPAIERVEYVDSLFEVKTVLAKNEADDGRPILFEKHPELPGCFSILGGKIDNIYDVLEKLDAEPLAGATRGRREPQQVAHG